MNWLTFLVSAAIKDAHVKFPDISWVIYYCVALIYFCIFTATVIIISYVMDMIETILWNIKGLESEPFATQTFHLGDIAFKIK